LLRFGKDQNIEALQKWARDYKFEKTLTPKINRAIADYQATQPSLIQPPIYIEHPIDPETQTGESQFLGGAMELKSPWLDH